MEIRLLKQDSFTTASFYLGCSSWMSEGPSESARWSRFPPRPDAAWTLPSARARQGPAARAGSVGPGSRRCRCALFPPTSTSGHHPPSNTHRSFSRPAQPSAGHPSPPPATTAGAASSQRERTSARGSDCRSPNILRGCVTQPPAGKTSRHFSTPDWLFSMLALIDSDLPFPL